jgi:OOP family OmpA-OmpF porin
VEGLTTPLPDDSPDQQQVRKVQAVRVDPSGKGTEMVEINVADQFPRVRMRIRFAPDSDELDRSSLPLLRELGAALHDPLLQGKHVQIAGHTDGDGSDEYNLKLSLRRARRVASWLTTHAHIDENNLHMVGFGKRVPLVPNTSAANKAKNRRVEISIQQSTFEKDMLQRDFSPSPSSDTMAW